MHSKQSGIQNIQQHFYAKKLIASIKTQVEREEEEPINCKKIIYVI